MVIIAQGNEPERLQNTVGRFSGRYQHLRHADHGADLGLKSNFDKVTLVEWFRQFQESTGSGNGKEFASRALAIIKSNCSQDGTA